MRQISSGYFQPSFPRIVAPKSRGQKLPFTPGLSSLRAWTSGDHSLLQASASAFSTFPTKSTDFPKIALGPSLLVWIAVCSFIIHPSSSTIFSASQWTPEALRYPNLPRPPLPSPTYPRQHSGHFPFRFPFSCSNQRPTITPTFLLFTPAWQRKLPPHVAPISDHYCVGHCRISYA